MIQTSGIMQRKITQPLNLSTYVSLLFSLQLLQQDMFD